MALIVETGAGLSNAESYASVSFCDTYHANYGNTAWAAVAVSQREVALRKATQAIDANFKSLWKGDKLNTEQALDWPREGVTDDDDRSISANIIPIILQRATAEMALRALSETLVPDIAEPGAIAGYRVKVGPIEEETTYMGGRSQVKKFRLVELLLTPFLKRAGMVERG